MRAGPLRKVGWLQARSTARDAYGGSPASWSDVTKIRYEIQTTSGREIDSAGNMRAISVSTVTMRFLPGVVPGMRIRGEQTAIEDTRYYNITAVNDVNQKHHELELTVSEDRTTNA